MTNSLKIEKLTISHNVNSFDCGNPLLNDFLKKYALTNQKMRSSTTYIALEDEKVVGYYSIASASVSYENAPKKVNRGLPQYDIPVLLLARLAIAVNKQGAGLGR
ncbi:MAG: GNAT family N-acetyltransferase, partial [Alphaproteobacteria bacterium]|nr:GNAT family N-acetyltransferase [Alphaproteobacteria bacterium]